LEIRRLYFFIHYSTEDYPSFQNMKVWLFEIGDLLPLKPGIRKMRTGLLADQLMARGHKVRWWASAFEHQRKVMLFQHDQEIALSPLLTLQVLRGCGYSRNFSLPRYIDHRIIAAKFRKTAPKLEPPDVVVAALPCYHLAFEAVRFGRRRNIPVLVDVRDTWPDIFLTRIRSPFLKKMGQMALGPDFQRVRWLLREAQGLVAVSDTYLDWALKKAGRPAGEWDRVFYLGYQAVSSNSRPPQSSNPPAWLKGHATRMLILFLGTFGLSYDLSLILAAAGRLQAAGREDVHFILAGTGEQEDLVHRESAGLANVSLPGWIDGEEITALLQLGYLGLMTYSPTAPQSLPYKPFEYLSAGLPLVSSLGGEMAEIINHFGLGLNYPAGELDGLCRSIETLLDNSSLRDKMSVNALAFFKEYGDADKIYTEYAKHLENLAIAGKKGGMRPQGHNIMSRWPDDIRKPRGLSDGLAAGGGAACGLGCCGRPGPPWAS
jgi:glycosyltransferase involved in cell wall biosynthesis